MRRGVGARLGKNKATVGRGGGKIKRQKAKIKNGETVSIVGCALYTFPFAGLLGVGLLPKDEQSRHSRAGRNPGIPQSTGHCAWMPACAGTTDQRNPACRKPIQLRATRKTSPSKDTDWGRRASVRSSAKMLGCGSRHCRTNIRSEAGALAHHSRCLSFQGQQRSGHLCGQSEEFACSRTPIRPWG